MLCFRAFLYYLRKDPTCQWLLSGTPIAGYDGRKDYGISYDTTRNRARVDYVNTVNPNARQHLTLTKKLYQEDGETAISDTDDPSTFSFRLYLGTEYDAAPEPANMHTYHAKDPQGNYSDIPAGQKRDGKHHCLQRDLHPCPWRICGAHRADGQSHHRLGAEGRLHCFLGSEWWRKHSGSVWTGSLTASAGASLSFENNLSQDVPTGVTLSALPFWLLLVLGAGLTAIPVRGKKREDA